MASNVYLLFSSIILYLGILIFHGVLPCLLFDFVSSSQSKVLFSLLGFQKDYPVLILIPTFILSKFTIVAPRGFVIFAVRLELSFTICVYLLLLPDVTCLVSQYQN